jgi:septum formation protein
MSLLSQIVAPEKIVVQVSGIKEFSRYAESPHDRVMRLSLEKASDVLLNNKLENNIEFIIGADTEIAIKNIDGTWEIIGDPHPKTPEEAKNCISKLNGKYHFAITGITVIGIDKKSRSLKKITKYSETKLKMANLSEKEIDAYIKTNEFFGRAGGYAIQGVGGILIESIDGSYSNIVGLPLELLTEILIEDFGRKISDFDSVSDWKLSIPINDNL